MSRKELLEAIGADDADAAFDRTWKPHASVRNAGREGRVTTPRQRIARQPGFEKNFKGFGAGLIAAKIMHARGDPGWKDVLPTSMKAVVDETLIGGNTAAGLTPLVFDPDILQILKDTAPILERIPEEGQAGFQAVVNRIDSSDAALGFRTETESVDLTGETNQSPTFDRIAVDMEIWVDKISLSDFSRLASAHYVDIRDTVLADRVRVAAQEKERNLLYGDPSLATDSGSFGDADGYEGYATIIEDAGNNVDKSAVDLSGTDALLKDIKAEIKVMLQGPNNVNKADLDIWTSHTLFDELENELEVRRRIETNRDNVNFGFETLSISGVPVIASHNVAEHTDTGPVTAGTEGDVFIMNRREFRFRSLMPLSTVTLGRVGFSEQAVMGEFGAPVLRGAGNLCRLLQDYQI